MARFVPFGALRVIDVEYLGLTRPGDIVFHSLSTVEKRSRLRRSNYRAKSRACRGSLVRSLGKKPVESCSMR